MKTSLVVIVPLAGLILLLSGCFGESAAEKHNSAGVAEAKVSRLEEAIDEFDEAIRLDMEFALAYYNRGQAYFAVEQNASAIQDYDEAIRLQPQLVLFYVKRGEAYFALGEYERAIRDYDEAVRRDPKFALAYYIRGGAYFELGEREQAIQDYEETIKLDRRFRSNGYRCGFYDDLDQYEPAIKDCSSLTRLYPRYAKAFDERGLANFEGGQYQRAVSDYDEAIRLKSTAELYNSRGLAYEGMGEFDEAFRDFREAIQRDPQFALALYNRGQLYYDLGYYQAATWDYASVIQLNPLHADAYTGRALAYTRLVKDERAQQAVDRAVELGVDRPELEEIIQKLKEQRQPKPG